MKEKDNVVAKDVKDVVFRNAFATEENLPEIYQALIPESGKLQSKENFELLSLESRMANHLVNDLSFLNKKDNTLVFIEAESSWNKSKLKRFFNYYILILAKIIERFSDIDITELNVKFFILSTSGKEPKQRVWRLFDVLKNKKEKLERFIPNLEFNIISVKNENIPLNTIVHDYFRFVEIQLKIFYEKGRNWEALELLIDSCIKENLFIPFMKQNKEDLMPLFEHVFNEKTEHERDLIYEREEGIEEGIGIGIEKGSQRVIDKLKKKLQAEGQSEDYINEFIKSLS